MSRYEITRFRVEPNPYHPNVDETKIIPDRIARLIFDVLVEVSPRHVDEFGFYSGIGNLLFTVFPAIKMIPSDESYETYRATLLKSSLLIKRNCNIRDIARIRIYSEEVSISKDVDLA